MVQLPATAAIEYVAACWVSGGGGGGGAIDWGDFGRYYQWRLNGFFSRGDFFPGGLLPGRTFGQGDFWPGGFLAGVLLSGGLLPGGTFPRGSFAWGHFCPGGLCPFPQVQCVYAPSRLSVPSIVGETDKIPPRT